MSALPTLEGTTILVTGASSGIGAALAPMLAGRGATVGIAARRADRLSAVLEACRDASPDGGRGDGAGHRMWTVDLSDPEAAARLAVDAWDAFGHLDAVVNNAARPMRRPVQRLSTDVVEDVMRTNFLSPVALTLAVLPRMLERDRGVVVNVGSLAGRVGSPREAAYAASKFALHGWSEVMAVDLWSTGVEVRLIVPGAIATEIWDQPGNDPSPYGGPFEPAETVAAAACEALVSDGFERYVPDLKAVAEFKTSDIDGFMQGAVDYFAGQEQAGRERAQ
ncbi:MAG TPA: SDR family NAD(P)-dependent oxidoreductase [Acidimicrobiales bacterium]|nr:SDR family NAD(P)-dependent oxidoreductase [Acidimicrobiales bacterium]